MVATETRPAHEQSFEQPPRNDGVPNDRVAVAAMSGLQALVPFDAVQLLYHSPQQQVMHEVLRIGYGDASSWALRCLFVEKYGPGFTHALSPNDGLPPAISSVRSDVRDEFTGSSIYRDYLRTNGFRDGMSMELFAGEEYVGIAHFSARRHAAFTESSRRAASSVGGLLAALLVNTGNGDDPQPEGWFFPVGQNRAVSLGTTPVPEFLESAAFLEHLRQFRETGLTRVRHLWAHKKHLYRLEIASSPGSDGLRVEAAALTPDDNSRLTPQELRVLALLSSGYNDAEIGTRLHLSRRTVESHVVNARRKLGAKNRMEAAVHVITTASMLLDPVYCPIGTCPIGAFMPAEC